MKIYGDQQIKNKLKFKPEGLNKEIIIRVYEIIY